MRRKHNLTPKSRYKLWAAGAGIIVLALLFAFITFSNKFRESELNRQHDQAQTFAQQIMRVAEDKLHTSLVHLENITGRLDTSGDLFSKKNLEALRYIEKTTNFERVGIADTTGTNYVPDGKRESIANAPGFDIVLDGGSYISDIFEFSRFEHPVLMLMVPLYGEDTTILGVLYAIYEPSTLSGILDISEPEDSSYSVIIDSNGKYVSTSKSQYAFNDKDNIWADLKSLEYNSEYVIDGIHYYMDKDTYGFFEYKREDVAFMAHYTPMNINDWYLFTSTPKSVMSSHVASTEMMMIQIISIVVICLMGVMVFLQFHSYRKTDKLQRSLTRYQELFATSQADTGSSVFEYFTKNHALEVSTRNHDNEFIFQRMEGVPTSVLQTGTIEDDSVIAFKHLFEAIDSGEKKISHEIYARKNPYAPFRWYQITVTALPGTGPQGTRALCVAKDIHYKKLQEIKEQKLLYRAEIDGLTKICNAKTLKERIDAQLLWCDQLDKQQIMLLLDLDNFKAVNDTLGHSVGDQTLIDVARILTERFRSSDIVGRLGGDEFVVLLKDVTNFDSVRPLLNNLLEDLRLTYTKDGQSVNVSVSIGAVVAPTEGKTFDELYQKADKALYYVKRGSKNNYCNYIDIPDMD